MKSHDWARIETPAGRATKVPALLAGLGVADADADAKVRAKHLAALRRLAIVEGEITAAAVPLADELVSLAEDAAAPELARVLVLLGDLLVCGSADSWMMKGYDVRIPAFDAASPDQAGRALYERIAVATPTWIAHLGHADATVRACVAPLLAYLSRETKAILPPLHARWGDDKDGTARGALAVALAHHARYADDRDARVSLQAALADNDPVARLGVAVALVIAEGADAADSVAETLLYAVQKQRKKVDAFPWQGGSLANLAVIATAQLAAVRGDLPLAERLVTAAARLPTHFWAVSALLDAAFLRDTRPTPRAPGELNATQTRAVLQVAAFDELETIASGLARLGLPADKKALRSLAGEGEPTALARVIDGDPLLRRAARALCTAKDEATWHAVVAALPEAERIDVVRDANCHPLRMWELPPPSDVAPEQRLFHARDQRALMTRVFEVFAADLATCSLPALVRALAELGKQELQPPTYRAALVVAACRAAARANEVVPESVDAPFAKINPGSSFDGIEAIRDALRCLPPPRREKVVLARHYWHSSSGDEVTAGGAWRIADLAPTSAVARAIVEEIVGWSGSNAPYPEAQAVEVLRRIGEPAIPIVRAAIAKTPKYVSVLQRALG